MGTLHILCNLWLISYITFGKKLTAIRMAEWAKVFKM